MSFTTTVEVRRNEAGVVYIRHAVASMSIVVDEATCLQTITECGVTFADAEIEPNRMPTCPICLDVIKTRWPGT